jgi:hypothetical protein
MGAHNKLNRKKCQPSEKLSGFLQENEQIKKSMGAHRPETNVSAQRLEFTQKLPPNCVCRGFSTDSNQSHSPTPGKRPGRPAGPAVRPRHEGKRLKMQKSGHPAGLLVGLHIC